MPSKIIFLRSVYLGEKPTEPFHPITFDHSIPRSTFPFPLITPPSKVVFLIFNVSLSSNSESSKNTQESANIIGPLKIILDPGLWSYDLPKRKVSVETTVWSAAPLKSVSEA